MVIPREFISALLINYSCCAPWASYQIRKIAGCACAGNAGNVPPRRRFQRKPLVSDPGMHHGTCVTHVPGCMSGSLTCGDGENVFGIPGACALAMFAYLARGPWKRKSRHFESMAFIHFRPRCVNDGTNSMLDWTHPHGLTACLEGSDIAELYVINPVKENGGNTLGDNFSEKNKNVRFVGISVFFYWVVAYWILVSVTVWHFVGW